MAVIVVSQASPANTLKAAVDASRPYDEISITGVVEVTDSIEVRWPLTFVGVGPTPTLHMRGLLFGGKGIFSTYCDTVVRNIDFTQARTLTGNAAGVWHEAGDLTLEDCRFIDNQNGVMIAGGSTGHVQVTRCGFINNGAGCGHTHGIYVNDVSAVSIDQCSFENTRVGHHVKSRARQTRVKRSYFAGLPGCTASYAIDIPNGGIAIVSQNQFVKSRHSMSRRFVSYCAEGARYERNSLEVSSNIFINLRRGPTIAVANHSLAIPVNSRDNAFEHVLLPLLGRGKTLATRESKVAITTGVL